VAEIEVVIWGERKNRRDNDEEAINKRRLKIKESRLVIRNKRPKIKLRNKRREEEEGK
jgi:hypothetical protein